LKIQVVPFSEFTNIYINNLTDPIFTGTVMSCDIEHDLHMHYLKTIRKKRYVSIPLTNSYYTLGFLYPNLWEERFVEIIEGLITGGIINWYLEKYTKSRWNVQTEELTSRKIVLNLSHLGFGFQICFFALYVALLVFCMEIIFGWTKKACSSRSEINVDSKNSINVPKQEQLCLDDAFGEKIDFVLEYLEEFEQIVKESHGYGNCVFD
jgi:hypothetical protein